MRGTISMVVLAVFFSLSAIAQTNAIRLDGVDDAIDLGNTDLGLTNELTVMAWVKWEANPQGSGVDSWANIISVNSENQQDLGQFWLQHSDNNQNFEFALQTTSGRTWIFSSTTPQENAWTHVAGVYRNDTMRLYINGIEENHKYYPGDIRSFQSDFHMYIGQWAYSGNSYRNFLGSLEDVAVFSRGLYPAEINAIMEDPNAVNTSDTTLEGFWTMDDSQGSGTITDLSQNNNDGTTTGGDTEIYGSDYPPVSDGSTLPVHLTFFDVKAVESAAVLSWTTASEQNSDYFELLRSADGKSFEKVARVKAAGNSNEILNYSYRDEVPASGLWYYKLKQVDFDGQFEIFYPVAVSIQHEFYGSLYPNPASRDDVVTIALEETPESLVKIQVLNSSGQLVYENDMLEQQLILPTDIFEKGIYFIRLMSAKKSQSLQMYVL